MSSDAKRARASKRDANVLNDDKTLSNQPTEKSVKREEKSAPSAQVVHLQQEPKKDKSDLELENDALKAEIDKLRKENAELQACPPRTVEKDDTTAVADDSDSGVIRFEIDNVSTMEFGDHRYSPEVEVGGVPWRAYVYNDGESICVSLTCMFMQSKHWMMDVDAEYILINSDSSKNVSEEEETLMNSLEHVCGGSLLDWEDVINEENGFVNDDKVIIEIHFSITNMDGVRRVPRFDFMDPDELRHDVALIVEGEKFYASKQYLSLHSPFFYTLFYGDFTEKNKNEIELKDVNREEFLAMLHAMYPSCRRVTDDSIEYLLKLGDRFQIACLIDQLEQCLSDAWTLKDDERLTIANQYGLKRVSFPSNMRDRVEDNVKSVAPNEPIDFTDPNEPRHDITLVIDGEKIYVSKQYLSFHSPFFNTLFYDEFKNEKEIELKSVDREEFLEMLHVVYPSGKKITDDSAEYLFKLGTRFQIACVIDLSEEYLCYASDITTIEKLRIADQYGVDGLEEHCLDSLITVQQFKEIENTTIFANLSKKASDALFKRLLEIA